MILKAFSCLKKTFIIKRIFFFLFLCGSLIFFANPQSQEASKPVFSVKTEFDVKVPLRDGVFLSADIYRPEEEGKYPAILSLTPYGNHSNPKTAIFFAERGYVFIIVDCRGRHDSEGEFYPLIHEAEDGYDVQEWVGKQPWCDRNIGTIGGSYGGWTQWLPAPLGNPHLKTMIPLVAPPDPFYNIPYQYGALMPTSIFWAFFVNGHSNQNLESLNIDKILKHLPLITMDEALGFKSKVWKDWVSHSRYDDYWKKQSYQDKYHLVKVPILHISGWYDDDQPGTTMNYVGMRKNGGSEEARQNQKLIMGPWPHSVNSTSKLGDIDFGPTAIIDLNNLFLRWYDRWLKGIKNGVDEEPKVDIFVMGENKWRKESDWPLPQTVYTKFYFHSKGSANSLFGDGSLSTSPPKKEPPDTFIYDPENPVPFITSPGFAQIGGPDDYRAIERRDDVLVYTSDFLEEDLEVTGPVVVKLYASSSAKDTDFTAKLLDVFPSGYAMRLCDGIVRARFRESLENPSLIEPGRVYEYTIDCWSTSNLFRKGHRIRVEISSSAFPKFDRNSNTGAPLGTEMKFQKATQTVYHSQIYPSHIILPVIPRKE